MVKLDTSRGGFRTYAGASSPLPSVTEVLKVLDDRVWINDWIARAGRREVDRKLNEASNLGTKVHAAAAKVARLMARGQTKVIVEPPMVPYAEAVVEFLETHTRRIIAVEKRMASDRLRFGGTVDLICEMYDGSLAVVDYKTNSNGITKVHKLQTAGYAMLAREHGYNISKRIVVRLHKAEDKQGQWYARAALDHRQDVEVFKACVVLWYFKHGAKLKGKQNGD